MKIKPYLRKLSSKDANSIDLSRPAAENEALAGLGITDYSPTVADVTFTGLNSRGLHNRSTSNNSQFSTSSSIRPAVPYMPPIRQTSRSYTPPISKSTPPSVLGSEYDADNMMTDEEYRLRQAAFDPTRRSGSLSSTPGAAQPLRVNTGGSGIRLGGSYGQSTASLTSPVGPSRSRGETLKSIDTTSPSSRTSFDRAFTFVRGGRDSPVDPETYKRSVEAARAAFREKEEAKERKYAKEAHKQFEQDYRKQYKKEERDRRKSESLDTARTARSRSVSDFNNEKVSTPRPSIGGRQFSNQTQTHSRPLPAVLPTVDPEKTGEFAYPQVTRSRAAKGRWLRFVTWFKTRILRISKRVM
jgi:hypothetical protein